jgi:ribosomal protein L7Ae-like RNA K-turn-binding protein
VRLDRSRSAHGRGVYICFDAVCLRKALKLSRLVSAFKCPVVVPEFDALYQALSMWLCERLKSCLQLAQKAGVLVSGSVSLQQALARSRVVCIVLAEDIVASRAEMYRSWCIQQNIPCLTLFTKEELGQLIGKSNRSAVGFTEWHFCRQMTTAIKFLEKLRSSNEPPGTNTSFCQLSS